MASNERRTAAIVGLGLIGGSLGLALQATGRYSVLGYARRPETRQRAIELGAVDDCLPSVAAAGHADLVVVAVPVLASEGIFRALAGHVDSDTVVTDVGSTKAVVERWASALLPGVRFVGGHPMAGKEQAGIEHADGRLFHGRTWAVVPPPGAARATVETVLALAHDVGALPLEVDAAAHDAAVAMTSHLPFLVACLLAESALAHPNWPALEALAGTGLRDTTRLASGDPAMHRDICASNREPILAALERFQRQASALADLIRGRDATPPSGRAPNPSRGPGDTSPLPGEDDVNAVRGRDGGEALFAYLQRIKLARDHWLQNQRAGDSGHSPRDPPPS